MKHTAAVVQPLAGIVIEGLPALRCQGRKGGIVKQLVVPGPQDWDHVQPVFPGEVEIPLVVGGASEDGAGAIVHQHEIGDIDRQVHIRQERVDGDDTGVVTALLRRLDRLLAGAEQPAFGDEVGELRIIAGQRARQGVVR